ncbi:MAG: metallophosphoesterase [Dorea sp.]|nr:metallophosphoesterase [Dorea sp.]
MRILMVADVESKALWDYYVPGMFDDIDLILSAGDLDADYLSFLVTMANVPVLYIHGNHDKYYHVKPPEGCTCIEDQIFEYEGVRILGLGGCQRYCHGPHQYTEHQMKNRIMKLTFKLLWKRGFDILLTHAPSEGCGDSEDLPHRGFRCFRSLIEKYHPSYHIYAHVHKDYGHKFQRIRSLGDTTVINAYEMYIIEYDK